MLNSVLDVYTDNVHDLPPGDAKLISRVFVGTFWEESILNIQKVYIDVYKITDGFILVCDWDWTCVKVNTSEQAQEVIEKLQDTWLAMAAAFL